MRRIPIQYVYIGRAAMARRDAASDTNVPQGPQRAAHHSLDVNVLEEIIPHE